MNADTLLEAIGNIDEKYVVSPGKKHQRRWLLPAAAAVLAALIGVGAVVFNRMRVLAVPKPLGVMLIGGAEGFSHNVELFTMAELESAKEDPVELVNKYDPELEKELEKTKCVLRIPFFVYGGRLYWQYASGDYGSNQLVGEKIGWIRKMGWLNKNPAEYDEKTGPLGGVAYEVKGFDPEFMLCMYSGGSRISLYTCSSGYVISKGEDVFEQRFAVSDKLETFVFEDFDSLSHGYDKRYSLDPALPEVRSFIEAIDRGSWHIMDRQEAVWPDGIYGAENEKYVLTFKLGGVDVTAELFHGWHLFVDSYVDCAIDLDEKDIKPLLTLMETKEKAVLVESNEPITRLTFEEAKADPYFGSYIPSYIPEGYELNHITGFYDIDPQTGKRIRTNNLYFEFRNAEERFLTISIHSANEMRENAQEIEEDKNFIAPLAELTVDTVKGGIGDSDPEFRLVGAYDESISIVIKANGASPEEMIRCLRSGFGS